MRSLGFDSTVETPERGTIRSLRTLAPYMWPPGAVALKVRVVIAVACLGAAIGAGAYVPFLLKYAVDALAESPTGAVIAAPVGLIVAYGLVRVLQRAFGELRDAVFVDVGQHAARTIARETFRHLHDLPLNFHLSRQTGGLSRIIDRGVKGIDLLLRISLFNVLPTLLQVVIFCAILLVRYDAGFAVVTLLTVAGYVAFTFVITNWRLKYRRQMNAEDQAANTKAVDSLLNFETVKYFGNEAHETRRFDDSLARYERAAIRTQTTLAALNIGQNSIIAVGLISVMTMAGFGVAGGTMTVGDFVLINAFLIQLYMPLGLLGSVYREIRQGVIDMEQMFQLLRVRSDLQDLPGAPALALDAGAVVFDDVHFAYEPDRPILKGVSFRVPAGRKVAIVGPSGAGKSTITRLLFRFYDVDAGAILIDGQDVRAVTQSSLRAVIGVVPQDTVLFNDTIAYNIRYGRPGASEEEVRQAARLAQIDDFISTLPKGYETMVGERGLKLSGGEKQRVAIARTFLKGPRILILDEATSALDSRTEREIQASLRQVSRDRTTLVIAHRLSTVVDADEILVLIDGQIAERGGHEALLRQDGHYAAMWARQQAEQAETEAAAATDEEEGRLPVFNTSEA